MVRHGRLALAQRLDEVADTDLALGGGRQDAEHPEPDRVGQRAETTGQLGGIGGVEGCRQNGCAALRRLGSSSQLPACSRVSLTFTLTPSMHRPYSMHRPISMLQEVTMSRVQLALNVSDIDEAVEFYSKLFGTEPAKRQPGYANFAIADPPLKLVLMEDADARGTGSTGALNHLGVEVETPDEVAAATGRLSDDGLDTEVEEQTTCCYRRPGQGLGERPRRRSLGGLHRPGRRSGRDRHRRRRNVLRPRGRVRRARERRRHAVRLLLLLSDGRPSGETAVRDTVLWRRLLAEFLGSAFLAAIVIGSGIAAQNLSPGDIGLQLLRERGGHGGRAVRHHLDVRPDLGRSLQPGGLLRRCRLRRASSGGTPRAYLPFQTPGASAGRSSPTSMFSEAAISISTKHRASGPHWLSEVVATVGLILVIFALARSGRSHLAPAAVGAYIGAAYFFTSSTSFANPAITVGPDVLQHLRRHRPVLGPELHLGPDRRRRPGLRVDQGPLSRA